MVAMESGCVISVNSNRPFERTAMFFQRGFRLEIHGSVGGELSDEGYLDLMTRQNA